jgi:cation diffusion facilitator CzcD-associated flavoprotein CzcO
VSPANEALRQALVAHLERRFGDRPGLLAKVVPRYAPGSKRMMRDNGVWPAALRREHVDLVTDVITEITPDGVRTADGVLHEADVLIYATGFRASDFLARSRSGGATASTCTSAGTATPAHTSASTCRASPTSSASSARTPAS